MHTYSFSAAQATHALQVVLTLMKERRFFLYRQEEYSHRIEGDLGHGLDPSVFGPALQLDKEIRAIYTEATRQAERSITETEQSLGLKAPDLSNKRLVQCNRYTGGLDICRVYPLDTFTKFVPDSFEELQAQMIQLAMGGKTADDYSPKATQELRGQARSKALLIWRELADMEVRNPAGHSCVVLLKTRFEPTGGDIGDDFLEGRLAGVQLFPHAIGYLFYQYSKHTRIVHHNHVAFNASRKAHVNVQHWTSGEPSLRFDSTGGYSCKVYFPIVL